MNLKNKSILNHILSAFLACLICLPLSATDEEADIETEKAKTAYEKQEYRDAGSYYMAARLYADSPEIKKLSLVKAAEAFGKANQKYKQFECLRDLIIGFPDQINFKEVLIKEYEIGNAFAQGHRDIKLSWMPWIKGKNKAVEIYETILKQAPFAKFAAALKLRLGRMYLSEDKIQKALKIFRQVMKQHPKAPEDKFARFELANALVQMSVKAGDGDGVYAREAEEVLVQALKKYPKDPETKWIKQSIQDTDDVRAKRLNDIAEFYVSRKNTEAATRYFHELLARYPGSEYAKNANKNLEQLVEDYKPRPVPKITRVEYAMVDLPPEPKVILIAPQASGGKWLLPIEDLDLDGKNAEMEYQAQLSAEKEGREKARIERRKRVAAERKRRKKAAADRKKKEEAEAAKKIEEEKKKSEATSKDADLENKKNTEQTEKATREKTVLEKREEELKAQADAEKKMREKQKKDDKEAEQKNKEKTNNGEAGKANISPTVKTDTALDLTGKAKVKSSSGSYLVPLIILLLIIASGIVYYIKKKQQTGA